MECDGTMLNKIYPGPYIYVCGRTFIALVFIGFIWRKIFHKAASTPEKNVLAVYSVSVGHDRKEKEIEEEKKTLYHIDDSHVRVNHYRPVFCGNARR